MKEIKTIIERAELFRMFDKAVNDNLRDGWRLVRRDVLPAYEGETLASHRALYAELERDVKTDCNNCRYCDLSVGSDPCRSCNNSSAWERSENGEV